MHPEDQSDSNPFQLISPDAAIAYFCGLIVLVSMLEPVLR